MTDSFMRRSCNVFAVLSGDVGVCIALAAVILFAVPANGQVTRYVNPDGLCGGNGPCYTKVQDAVTAAVSGDEILVAEAVYPEKIVLSTPGIILRGDGSYPKIRPDLDSGNSYDTVIMVKAANVTIEGFDISNALGIVDQSHHAIWDGEWTVGPPGLTVHDCIIHDIEFGVRSYGSDFTVTSCEMFHLLRSGVHASGPGANTPLSMTIRNNWLHDWSHYSKNGAGIFVKHDSRVGVVSYNYISGMRMGIAYYYGGPKASYDQKIIFTHNTIDLDYDPGDGPVLMTMGFSLWGTGKNADAVVIQDNIFAHARWYAIYQEGATIDGSFLVENNLFFDNYWYWWPDYQYPHQWFGDDSIAQVGWYESLPGFRFTNNLTATDPLFELTGDGAENQWALQVGSPAYATASDGTNIGAWQGQHAPGILMPAPAMGSRGLLLLLLILSVLAARQIRAGRRM